MSSFLCAGKILVPFVRQGSEWFVKRPGALKGLTVNSSWWTITCSVRKGTQCFCLKLATSDIKNKQMFFFSCLTFSMKLIRLKFYSSALCFLSLVLPFSPPVPLHIHGRMGGPCIFSPQRWNLGRSKYFSHFLVQYDVPQQA